ncbi:lipoprotein [Bordetella hinzii]|uniref:tripartite tricarboxylate transporter substrate-binding protein n=1 Tax=Bordetella hinzii TaxID=103855 RepID=UPI00040A0882|nr:tripartite tricarboxylate transporter substrate-binding protein [Bordetella hinzii]AKQ53550.1 Tripartite tricarboxylate transporter family receptor [Bordetella hinzii]KCB21438.1 tripartite tricarboxylate transporter family receptor [Bordetella hinzii L60]KCB31716.1 tripartite tricarboxylate transporter family receptor [Bordetella hinzii CA90 BAL1384]SNW00033.1 lipoprotein [Bordetella hinzii]
MKRIPMSRRAALLALGGLLSLSAQAQDKNYPTHPLTLVVPFAAGGPTDVVARSLGASMSKTLGQPIVVENRTGAGGTLGPSFVSRAHPDGYTLLIHHNGMATAPALYKKLPYDPLKDFEYIGQVADVPMTLMGRKSLPPNDMPAFIAYARANGNKINLANAGPGAVSQLCGTLLQDALGTQFTEIPYAGTAPAMSALLGGQVDVLCDQTTQTLPQIKGGSVKLYGVTTLERIKALPDAPTLQESGLKGFEVKVWHGIYAPKGTPKATIDRINEALRIALKDPAFATKMNELGAEIVPPAKQTPEGLHTWLQSETTKWGGMMKKAGIEPQ